MLQETNTTTAPAVQGYKTVSSTISNGRISRGTATLVKKRITALTTELPLNSPIETQTVEVIMGKESIFMTNVYSNPRQNKQRFHQLLHIVCQKAQGRSLVIAGDFNAPHMDFGHERTTLKARNLLQDAAELDLHLITDPTQPTLPARRSTHRDTTPDLTFTNNAEATWRNTGEDYGSDHKVVEVTVPLQGRRKAPRQFTYVDWNRFREHNPDASVASLEAWTQSIRQASDMATRTVSTDEDIDMEMDSRLARLIEAKQSITARWRRQRLNRRLRKRVAELNRKIEDHCRQLRAQRWEDICNQADAQMHKGSTWNLLRHLLDSENTKMHQHGRLNEIIARSIRDIGEEATERILLDKYLPNTPAETHPEYTGTPNGDLDKNIERWEVKAALAKVKGKSAAGPDGISNKALKNLEDGAIEALTNIFNKVWETGSLPTDWKTAKVILIPKPGKPPDIRNLRPISLTSCVGKVLEHVLLNRWQRYMESNNLYPTPMIGFRNKLGTHDAMLLIKKEIVDVKGCSAILSLDMQGAFDNVRHATILEEVNKLNFGQRSYNFIRDFLSGRQASIQAADIKTAVRNLGSQGTPQGSVISPLLFNIAMLKIAKALARTEAKYTLYADDITIWTNCKTEDSAKGVLQTAVNVIEEALQGTGLKCAPNKSELLCIKHRKTGWDTLQLQTKDGPIPRVGKSRILGLTIEETKRNSGTIHKLEEKITASIRLIRRISSRRRGMKEQSICRMVQAFAISHIVYVASFLDWTKAERRKINALIRKAYAQALGTLRTTSVEKLLDLGVHNTFEEIIEAQSKAHQERLKATRSGREILKRVVGDHALHEDTPSPREIPQEARELINVRPIPRHMHPVHDRGRREARAQALYRIHGRNPAAVYVDAACGDSHSVVAVVHAETGSVLKTASVKTGKTTTAEEVAIALATTVPGVTDILSDSMSAIRNFGKNSISREAARIFRPRQKINLTWTPAHEDGNMLADEVARGLLNRALSASNTNPPDPVEYGEILRLRRLERKKFPAPDPKLLRREATTLRQLQTEQMWTPVIGKHVFPQLYKDDTCKLCREERATLYHIMWDCTKRPQEARESKELPPEIQAAIVSKDYETQLQVIRLATELLERQVGTDPSQVQDTRKKTPRPTPIIIHISSSQTPNPHPSTSGTPALG